MKKLLPLLFLFSSFLSYTQDVDSLWGEWSNPENPDTFRLQSINTIIRKTYLFTNPDTAFKLAEMQYDYADSVKNGKWSSVARTTQGITHHIRGDYYNAIKYYNKGLKIAEENGDKVNIASSLNNIGIIYKEQENNEKALEYFMKSFKIKKEIGQKSGIANSLGNIGGIYQSKKEYGIALDYFNRGLKIIQEIDNKRVESGFLNNIGSIHINLGEYEKGEKYLRRSLAIREQLKDNRGIASTYRNLAIMYNEQGNYAKSLEYNKKSLELAQTMGLLAETFEASKGMYVSYHALGKYKEALQMYELAVVTNDSINSEKNQKEVIRQEYKHEYEKQKAIDDKENEKKLAVSAEQKKKQKIIIYATVLGLLLVIIFSIFIYKRLQVTRKQKLVIESQNQEILDSIAYAKRIQTAILPPDKLVKEYLQNSFIIYKPKDIVAGDFYWMEHKDGKVLFAAADCTGHGVPGAMVSVICNNGLNRSVREHGLTEPAKILDKTREIVIQEFEKSEEEVKDGMDIALCSLKDNQLEYAGAHNPLWIIRNGGNEVEEIKANKQPIGKYRANEPYTNHKLDLEKGDTIYIFSDGYVDQFGGEKGKKFMTGSFKKLLLSIQSEPMNKQKQLLEDAFEKWKGGLEQLDDVCVIGVKV